jgi:predicted transcriptional regulator
MKSHASAASATYTPQSFKNFAGALCAFFEDECPQLGGLRTRQVLVNNINEMVGRFFPETTHLRPGQTTWVTVSKDEKASYGKTIRNTKLTVVNLDLVQSGDAADRAAGAKLRDMKKAAAARLCTQAYEQGGCLTNAEVAILLKISAPTVGKYIAEWETENHSVLPRRGSIHDMGPTLTHKKIIIDKLFLEQKTVQQTSRETYHSLPAIERYISTFRQTLLCARKGMNVRETAFAVGKTERLMKEYFNIIDYYKSTNQVLEKILSYQPHIENNIEQFANEYGQEVE